MINVSNIERFAIHDGPGIRTTVFLMGCPLHCPWCANPETWTVSSVLMHDEKKCVHCHSCQTVCPVSAISFSPDFQWDSHSCIRCGRCAEHCLYDALTLNGKWMETEEVMEEVMKDRDYYQASGGGLTVSGGEPFFQFDACMELLEKAKENRLHVAVETTGNYERSKLTEAMPLIDTFLFDIKHINASRLKEVTGADMDTVTNNLDMLCAQRKEDVIIRVPVIPGFNEDCLQEIIEMGKRKQVAQVHLLPFHSMAKNKWEQLNREYAYQETEMMDPAHLKQYESDFVQIGG